MGSPLCASPILPGCAVHQTFSVGESRIFPLPSSPNSSSGSYHTHPPRIPWGWDTSSWSWAVQEIFLSAVRGGGQARTTDAGDLLRASLPPLLSVGPCRCARGVSFLLDTPGRSWSILLWFSRARAVPFQPQALKADRQSLLCRSSLSLWFRSSALVSGTFSFGLPSRDTWPQAS